MHFFSGCKKVYKRLYLGPSVGSNVNCLGPPKTTNTVDTGLKTYVGKIHFQRKYPLKKGKKPMHQHPNNFLFFLFLNVFLNKSLTLMQIMHLFD